MKNEIIRRKNIFQDFTTNWTQMRIQNLDRKSEFLNAVTINILWEDVRFLTSSPPSIIVECSEDGRNPFFVKEFVIDSVENSNDSTAIVVTQLFDFIRFKIVPNSSDEGNISIFINYR